ncbi:division/cell wall cluster transcriptional repressor MraZ [Candidatus Microgenomates bacterium]|nr:division/cell wall cluster transcriptional repressor MraZ [Candidatus Microgenomates bacterium]
MSVFLGEFQHNLDDRGRLSLPKKLRQELASREVVLTRGFENCIFGYPKEIWLDEAKRQLEIPVFEQKGRSLRRYVFSAAVTAEIDKLGRVLIPMNLKDYALIKNEVAVIGAGDHFEIWDSQKWKEYLKTIEPA